MAAVAGTTTACAHTATTEIYTLSLHDALPIYHVTIARTTYAPIEEDAE